MNMMYALSSTRLTWKVAAGFALLAAVLAFYASPIFAQSPPAAPDSVTATRSANNGSEQLAVSWSAVEGADGYHVNISGNGKGSWTRILSDVSGTSATIDKNLKSDFTYHVAVAAVKSGVTGGWTNSAAVPPLSPPPSAPGTPSSVTVTRADGSVSADWHDVSGATKYHVTYSTDNRNSWHLATSERPYSDITINNTDNSKTYIVAVRAGNAVGWSGWRNSAPAGPYTPPTPPPAAPASVTVTRADGTVTASGYAVSNATKYHITYSSNDKRSWTAASDNHTSGSITISGADNSKTYYVAVRAGNSAGWSGWRNSASSGPYTPPSISAPSNLSVTPGDGYLDISWDAVTGATGYDVRAKASGSATWTDVASNITTTSHRYTTSATIDYVAVRARDANGPGAWAEISRSPANEWLNTVQQSGGASQQSVSMTSAQSMSMASGQSVSKASANGQSQLAAPASITVTRDNWPADERLNVTWAAVTGAEGYNLACTVNTDNSPLTSWSWWHCGSITSGSTTTFAVENDERRGQTRDLSHIRSYAVAVRAVTSNASDASPWLVSDDAHPALEPEDISVSRVDGSVSVSWTPPKHLSTYTQGYEIECATFENNVTGTYTRCADVESATAVNNKFNVTISSWTADGTDYTIDDTKTYDLRIRTTNAWGTSSWRLAPLIYPTPVLTVSSVGLQTAVLTISRYTGNWYYKANTGPHSTCQGPVLGTITILAGLTTETAYDYSAYSDSGCTTANLLATAAQFSTHASVSNITASDRFDADIHNNSSQAVAFTTGPSNAGYALKAVTVPLRIKQGNARNLTLTLHAMQGTGTYSSSSTPSSAVLATLSGSDPTGSTFVDTTFTCSGSGCNLSPSTTYFIVARSTVASPTAFAWAWKASTTETRVPTGNGWSIGYDHLDTGRGWESDDGYNLTKLAFNKLASLSASSVTTSDATLSIANHNGTWYYKANAAPDNTCKGPVNGTTKNLTGLTAGTAYTYSAYSDSTCAAGNLLATADAFTTLSDVSNLTSPTTNAFGPINSTVTQAVAFTTGSSSGGYTLDSITLPLSSTNARTGLNLALHVMQGSAQYSTDSVPGSSELAGVTFSGTDPTGAEFVDTTYTCSGDGCNLSASTTYFIVATNGDDSEAGGFRWAVSESETEVARPSNNGWGIGYNHYTSESNWTTDTPADWARAKFVFATSPGSLTSSGVTKSGATLTIASHSGSWYYKATSGPHTSCSSAQSGTTATLSGLTAGTTYTYSTYNDSGCATLLATVAFTTVAVPTLSAGSIGATNAVLTIANHTGNWYYKADTGPHTSCSSVQSGATATLTTLTAGTTYTYKAYSDSGCTTANLLATASAFTTAITAGNLGETTHSTLLSITNLAVGQAFTTGSASNGYTLLSTTLDFAVVLNASVVTVSIRSEATNQPGSTDLATLTGTPASGQQTFNCSGAGCNLSASTTYYVYVVATAAAPANINSTASDNETLAPSTNGWSIANAARYEQGVWAEYPHGVSMKVELEAVAR